MRALVLYTPSRAVVRKRAERLGELLSWRGFEPEVTAGRPEDARDVRSYHLVALVFPALRVPVRGALPPRGVRRLVESLEGLEGRAVALLGLCLLDVSEHLERVERPLQQRGAELVARGSAPPVGPDGGVVDLAAECMVRLTDRWVAPTPP